MSYRKNQRDHKGRAMSNDLTLIQKLVAVELGCEWEYDIAGPNAAKMNLVTPVDQSLRHAMKVISENRAFRLTAKPWDWPVCERECLPVWYREDLEMAEIATGFSEWAKGIIHRSILLGTDGKELVLQQKSNDFKRFWAKQVVVSDPRSPDQPPPEGWSPEGRRVVK
jgi:hypothetical protein